MGPRIKNIRCAPLLSVACTVQTPNDTGGVKERAASRKTADGFGFGARTVRLGCCNHRYIWGRCTGFGLSGNCSHRRSYIFLHGKLAWSISCLVQNIHKKEKNNIYLALYPIQPNWPSCGILNLAWYHEKSA